MVIGLGSRRLSYFTLRLRNQIVPCAARAVPHSHTIVRLLRRLCGMQSTEPTAPCTWVARDGEWLTAPRTLAASPPRPPQALAALERHLHQHREQHQGWDNHREKRPPQAEGCVDGEPEQNQTHFQAHQHVEPFAGGCAKPTRSPARLHAQYPVKGAVGDRLDTAQCTCSKTNLEYPGAIAP